MTKRVSRRIKLNIFLVAVKIALCFSLLIFGTYAMFSSKDQKSIFVTAANVRMELFTVDLDGTETDISGGNADIFKSDYWEPGQTRVVFFKVVSQSDVKVKYTLNLIVSDDELDGAIEYFAFESRPYDVQGMTWESISQSRSIQYLTEGHNSVSGDDYVPIAPGEAHYYALFVHMREDAGDLFQDKMTDVEVYLYATQGNAELN